MCRVRCFAALLAFCAALACGPAPEPPARAAPDVLLVVLDTVRADRLSAYGHDRPTSPRLDALARLGVLFEDVTAPAPWTWPSHASIFTGLPPAQHGAELASDGGVERFGLSVRPLRGDVTTLAERFRAAGYRTSALVVNDWLHPELGLLRGFEQTHHFDRDAALIRAAPAVVAAADPRPLFLFVNVMTAHSPFRDGPGPWALPDRDFRDPERAPAWVRPYLTEDLPRGVHLSQVDAGGGASGAIRHAAGELEVPPEDLEKLMALYDASIAGADYVLGRVLDAWLDAQRAGVVAVTSDHGEGFGEHGMLDHRASVYPEVLRVPLVIAAPDRLPAARRVAAPVALTSLHDTLLALAGLPAGDASLLPLLDGGPAPEHVTASAGSDRAWARHAGGRFARGWRLYRRGNWALVHDERGGSAELYHLGRDPGMTRDLAGAEPARTAELLDASRAHQARVGTEAGTRATAALDIPDGLADRLRSLGYAAPATER